MSIEQIAAEALKLPARERARLAGSLWESVEDLSPTSLQAGDHEDVSLAQERDHQMESGQIQGVPHAEMMARLRR
jgi:hypothetical protein